MAEILENPHRAEVSAYEPTWRDRAAMKLRELLGSDQGPMSPETERLVSGLTGSTGAGSSASSIFDLIPGGAAIPALLDTGEKAARGDAQGAGTSGAIAVGNIAGLPAAALRYGIPTMAGLLAGGVGLSGGASAAEQDKQAAEDGRLRQLYSQQADLNRRRSEAEAEANAEARTGKGPNWQRAAAQVQAIDTEMAGLNRLIAEEQKRNSPEFQLEMEQKRKAADEAGKKAELDKPFAERHPYIATSGALGGSVLAGLLSRYGLGKIAAKGEDLLGKAVAAREAGDTVTMAEALKRAEQWGRWAPAKQAATIGAAATIPADLRGIGDAVDKYALPESSKAQQSASRRLGDPVHYAIDAIPALVSGATGSLVGAKLAKAAPVGDVRALNQLYGGESPTSLAAILKEGVEASSDLQGALAAREAARLSGMPSIDRGALTVGAPALPGQAGTGLPTSSRLGGQTATGQTRLTGPAGQRPATGSSSSPSSQRTLSSQTPSGGRHPDDNWDANVGRWRRVDGKFKSGKPPTD
jgi:hypothetical protein